MEVDKCNRNNSETPNKAAEIWKNIPGYGDKYAISSLGRLKNTITGRFLKYSRAHGYPFYTVCAEGRRHTLHVHRALAQAFIPNPMNYPEINHLDSDRGNFSLDNLEWCTHRMNMQHAGAKGHMARWGARIKVKTKLEKMIQKRQERELRPVVQGHDINTSTFPEIWASLSSSDREELTYQLLKARCTTTKQTVWNWANDKRRPSAPLIRNEIAKCVTKVTGKRVIANTLFPGK